MMVVLDDVRADLRLLIQCYTALFSHTVYFSVSRGRKAHPRGVSLVETEEVLFRHAGNLLPC